jgi:hypothetical protein
MLSAHPDRRDCRGEAVARAGPRTWRNAAAHRTDQRPLYLYGPGSFGTGVWVHGHRVLDQMALALQTIGFFHALLLFPGTSSARTDYLRCCWLRGLSGPGIDFADHGRGVDGTGRGVSYAG